jgi:hypothetical protein
LNLGKSGLWKTGEEMSALVETANVLHLRPGYPGYPVKKTRPQAKAAKAMTIIAGFRCEDGVVLAADTEITLDGGTGKTYQSKIFAVSPELGCHLAYTGDSDFAQEFVDHLVHNIGGKTSQQGLAFIKTAYRDFIEEHYTKAPKGEKTWAWILVTLRHGTTVHLYRGRNRHFTEIKNYAVLGIGQDQAESAFKPLYYDWITIQQAEFVMIYALRKVKGFVQGCGGDSEIRLVEDVESWLSEYAADPQSTKEIEEDFDFLDREVRRLIIAFSDMTKDADEFNKLLALVNETVTQYRAKRLQEYEKRLEEGREAYKKTMEGDL